MQTKAEQANDLIETLAVTSSSSIQVLTECRLGDFRAAMYKAGLSPEEQKDMTAARRVLKERDRLALKNFPPLSVAALTPKLTKTEVFFTYFLSFFVLLLTNQTRTFALFFCMIYVFFYDLETAAS